MDRVTPPLCVAACGMRTAKRLERDGTFRFDRVFAAVGRITHRSGTRSRQEFKRRDGILLKLYEASQLEVLRAFKRGDIAMEQLVEMDRVGRLKEADLLAELALSRSLWDTVAEYLPRLGKGEQTRRRYAVSLTKLRSRAGEWLPANSRVRDLLEVDWNRLESEWGGSAADWNHLRRAISTLLTAITGDVYSSMRRRVLRDCPLRHEQPRTPDLPGPDFWHLVNATPEHARPCYIVLAVTGMRLGEYLRCDVANLSEASHSIAVPGTKTAASKAVIHVHPDFWPDIVQGIPSPLQRKWLSIYFKRAAASIGKPELRIHDLRHVFAQLADEAGCTAEQTMVAMRHTNPAMTRAYKQRRDKGEVANAVGLQLLKGRKVS
jgi:integrase